MNPVSFDIYTRRKLAAWRHGRYSCEYREAQYWREETWRLWREAYRARRAGAALAEVQQLAIRACQAGEHWACAADRYAYWADLHRELKRDGNEPISLTANLLTSLQSVPPDILEEWKAAV